MTILRVLALAALAASGSVLAQSGEPPPRNNAIVYKCVNADGSVVYAQDPCSTDPKKMVTLDTSGALRTGSGGHQDEISAGVADSNCRDEAYRATHVESEAKIAESNTHINDYRQRIAALQSQASYGTLDPATAKAIDDLDAAIAKESEFQQKEVVNIDRAYQDALKQCDAQLRNGRVPASEEPAAPPPAPAPAPPAAPPPAEPVDNGGG